MITDCASAARPSAFPCPNRCSRSAGFNDTLTAKKVISEASTSRPESTRELSSDTESVIRHAQAFNTTRIKAVLTEA